MWDILSILVLWYGHPNLDFNPNTNPNPTNPDRCLTRKRQKLAYVQFMHKHVLKTAFYLTLLWRHLRGSLWAVLVGCMLPVLVAWQYYSTVLPVLYTRYEIPIVCFVHFWSYCAWKCLGYFDLLKYMSAGGQHIFNNTCMTPCKSAVTVACVAAWRWCMAHQQTKVNTLSADSWHIVYRDGCCWLVIWSLLLCPERGVNYCDQRVCMSVCLPLCLSACISL